MPSDFDRIVSGYRLIQTALLGCRERLAKGGRVNGRVAVPKVGARERYVSPRHPRRPYESVFLWCKLIYILHEVVNPVARAMDSIAHLVNVELKQSDFHIEKWRSLLIQGVIHASSSIFFFNDFLDFVRTKASFLIFFCKAHVRGEANYQ